jgi:hypothetical protein
MTAGLLARFGVIGGFIALGAAFPWAFDSTLGGTANQPPQGGGAPVGVVWMVFVDDLHADFRNTGRLRNLLKAIATELIQDGDSYGMRTSGPSPAAIDITSDRSALRPAIGKVSGNALRAADLVRSLELGGGSKEIASRSSTALSAARHSLERLIEYEPADAPSLPKALIYVSNGYYFDALPPNGFPALSDVRLELAGAAARAGVKIITIDPRVAAPSMPELDLDPEAARRYWTATQESLRPLWQETGGFAILQHEDLFTGLSRVSAALRR